MSKTAPPSYFVDHKKGEVNELKALLRAVATAKDSQHKRDLIQKVIAYMTLGIDVSRLFSEMVMASNTKDLVVKKMVFLYLCNYAATNPELTLLTINTLQKDCRNDDPMVRGLALRSLCSLRLPTILEYVMQSLKESLKDSSAYVRKTGIMGLLKVYHLAPALIKDGDNELVDTLYNMLRDRDAQVVVNCIVALNEMLAEDGGAVINQTIVHHLLNRIRDFNEWGQCVVLELVSRYRPSAQDETFAIMNLLDGCLRVSNSAVVLGTCKVFLALTEDLPDIQTQVYRRMKTPLLTLVASTSSELAYVVLQHVIAFVERCPGVFDDEYKQFYLRYNEPTCVKHAKLDILPRLANASNISEVLAELSEYVLGVDAELARHAIRSTATVVVRYPAGADRVIESLLEFAEMDVDHVRSETVIAMSGLLRKYPERAEDVLPSLESCLKRVEEPRAKAAVIWMVGEFGQHIPKAPYLLEPLIDAVVAEEEDDTDVISELLAASLKLFLVRAPEVQHMLGRLFKSVLEESTAAVHDRALLYYRLLQTGVAEAQAVVASKTAPPKGFVEETKNDLKDAIFKELNTLSVVYGEPSHQFVPKEYQMKLSLYHAPATAAAPAAAAAAPPAAPAAAAAATSSGMNVPYTPTGSGAGSGAGAASSAGPMDFLGVGAAAAPAPAAAAPAPAAGLDLLGDLFGAPAPAAAPVAAPAVPVLAAQATLAPADFQAKWGTLSPTTATWKLARVVPAAELEKGLAAQHINTMASGAVGTNQRFFFFGQDTAGAYHMAEVVVDTVASTMSVTAKGEAPGFITVLRNALGGLVVA